MCAEHPDLTRNLVGFAARLRTRLGFTVGPGEVESALRVLAHLNLGRLEQVRSGLRLVFTTRPEQRDAFDEAFDRYFLRPGQPFTGPQLPQQPGPPERGTREGRRVPVPPAARPPAEDGPAAGTGTPSGNPQAGELGGDAQQSVQAQYSASPGDSRAPTLNDADQAALQRAAGALLRRLALGQSRRMVPRPRGRRLDFRRTLREALGRAGELTTLRYLGRARRLPRVLVILDASRSMAAHAGLLLRYAHALSRRSRRIEVYAFSTGLRRLTPLLRAPGPPSLPALGPAWGGGTRIGENLRALLRQEGARLLGPDTLVLLLSDGLDLGEPALLAAALAELRRRSSLLVWLNPLLGLPGYQPTARGMAAALPFLDLFADAGGIGALETLPDRLRLRR